MRRPTPEQIQQTLNKAEQQIREVQVMMRFPLADQAKLCGRLVELLTEQLKLVASLDHNLYVVHQDQDDGFWHVWPGLNYPGNKQGGRHGQAD